ncbi:MAG: hypothetical protein PHT47_06540 [Candidatus Cloacimonetes bacterium]|nr:hypothetical protein [Candidatus Cloacimonadota bacterium]MDD4100736.1 hypothetical protein [Candidatus Cloacimonadota bacterium]
MSFRKHYTELGEIAKISHQSELQGGEGIAPLNCVDPLAEYLTVD